MICVKFAVMFAVLTAIYGVVNFTLALKKNKNKFHKVRLDSFDYHFLVG